MTLEGDPGSCLEIIPSGYWLKINPSCYTKQFQISCKEDFITTLLYGKPNSDTIYVSSATHSAASLGSTTEEINSRCFRSSGSGCDYEGSLWTTLALQKVGRSTTSFVPYLVALSSENQQVLPSAFIYTITAADDQYSELLSNQKQSRYWEAPSTRYNRFFDTALAFYSLSGSDANEIENAKNYLLSIQTKEGCFNNNNIRDTAFLLYSGWPRGGSTFSGGSSSNGTTIREGCELSGHFCEFSYSCTQAGGIVLSGFSCSGAQTCCSVRVQQQSCSSKNGKICSANEQCSSSPVSSLEGSCCLDNCNKITSRDTCTTDYKGTCKSDCSSDESLISAGNCLSPAELCCKAKGTTSTTKSNTLWIWILLILILLIILAIIFKNNLILYWYKFKGRASSSPAKRSPPSSPSPQLFRQMPMRLGFAPPQKARPSLPASRRSPRDNEMEETLKKLREMSK